MTPPPHLAHSKLSISTRQFNEFCGYRDRHLTWHFAPAATGERYHAVTPPAAATLFSGTMDNVKNNGRRW